MNSRRNFIKGVGATAGLSLSAASLNLGASSSNKTLKAALIGVRSRGKALAEGIFNSKNIELVYNCDVDDEIIQAHNEWCQKSFGKVPKVEKDFRKVLADKDVDVVFIATPEHWHTPMAILAMQAGKHVYVEKPCSHNPHENQLLVAAQKKYNKFVQMGNQQRSAVTSYEGVKVIHQGIIGEAYSGKAWYSNTRGTIGNGKVVDVPATLDWDLWQGPAPREAYRDNIHPYNWHWFTTWGTGEVHNNGTHELDICRWALGVDTPTRVTSMGGRHHDKTDDWQFYDTQVVNYEFEKGQQIRWEGYSCNGLNQFGEGRGALIQGTKGSAILYRSGSIFYDLKGKIIREESESDKASATATTDTVGFDALTVSHIQNLTNAILNGEKLRSPIDDASKSTMMCHYGNIAQQVGRGIVIDPKTGYIVDDTEAMTFWRREYEPGWEPTV
jgi:predicted dehydrogenase